MSEAKRGRLCHSALICVSSDSLPIDCVRDVDQQMRLQADPRPAHIARADVRRIG